MKKILVATDLSSRSEVAVMRAALLARQHQAELIVLHVIDDDMPTVLTEPQRLAITDLLTVNAEAIRERGGADSQIVVRIGDPVKTILNEVREQQADLLVMGMHRHTPLRDLFVGTTLERIIRNASVPVLRVIRAPNEDYRKIMFAVDFSETSAKAIREARSLGFFAGADLIALHAFEPFVKGVIKVTGVSEHKTDHLVEESQTDTTTIDFRQFIDDLELPNNNVQMRVVEGLPVNVIMAEVCEQLPQLLVLGTQGLKGIRRALIGSVAEAALNDVPCDVLAVPPQRD